jgi:hypothetical protein
MVPNSLGLRVPESPRRRTIRIRFYVHTRMHKHARTREAGVHPLCDNICRDMHWVPVALRHAIRRFQTTAARERPKSCG